VVCRLLFTDERVVVYFITASMRPYQHDHKFNQHFRPNCTLPRPHHQAVMASWKTTFAAVGGAAHHLQHKIAPTAQASLGGVAKKVGHHFHSNITPAVGGVIAHAQSNTMPAVVSLQGPMSHIGDRFRKAGGVFTYNVAYQVQAKIVPGFHNTVARAREVSQNIGPATKEAIEAAIARLHETSGERFEKLLQILLHSVEEVQTWVKSNRGKTAFLVVSTPLLVAPVIIVGPALAGLGFGAGGVAARRSNRDCFLRTAH
jgi:hypothetical protein